MCELFAYSSKKNHDITKELKGFYARSVNQPNGWGLAEFDDVGRMCMHKYPERAIDSKLLPRLIGEGIGRKRVLAHIRYATVGSINVNNCHPFVAYDSTGREWTMIHNGTVFNGTALLKYFNLQDGETDSERLLLYLMDLIDEATRRRGHPLDRDERFDVIESMLASNADRNKLNLFLYDGEQFYVHANNAPAQLHYTEDTTPGDEALMFATVPYTDADWQPVPQTQLIAFRDGRFTRFGKNHHVAFHSDYYRIKLEPTHPELDFSFL